jgi:hypothetical protein
VLVHRLGDDRERLDIRSLFGEGPVEVLDLAELLPGGAGEPSRGENFQREGWRRGLEPPTTGTTTRGSTN